MSVMFFAFSTLSSNATIPLNMHKLEDMGVSHVVSSFTVPLGATINKNGTLIMQSVATMFAAQYCGMDLGTSAILTTVFTLILASSSTPSVPFSGLATLTLVFTSIGIPLEMIGLLVGIDHILDTFRTAVNITGDAITITGGAVNIAGASVNLGENVTIDGKNFLQHVHSNGNQGQNTGGVV